MKRCFTYEEIENIRVKSLKWQTVTKLTQASISDMFAPEAAAGIRIFTGAQDLVDIADISSDERNAILYAFDLNVKKIENVSPKLAATLRPQREAFVKWGQIAKGIFPETKVFAYPGQSGGLGVDFLCPYLWMYNGTQTSAGVGSGNNAYTGYNDSVPGGYGSWDATLTAGAMFAIAGGPATQTASINALSSLYYAGSGITSYHSYTVIAQDGIIEIGTTPKIEQLFFRSQLLDKYTPIAQPPTLAQTIESEKSVYQYTTPGMIPISHLVGMQIYAMPNTGGVSTLPLLGMTYYETNFNKNIQAGRFATSGLIN